MATAVAEDATSHDQGGEDGPCLTNPDVAEYILQSRKTIAALESAKDALIQVGAMASVVQLDNEIRKEERALRQRSSENPDVLRALARHMHIEAAEAARRKRLADDANARTLTSRKLN